MTFSLLRTGQTLEVSIDGHLVAGNRQEFKQAILEELSRGASQFRIDFERTRYIDSSGLGVLVSLSKKIREQGGELRVANLNGDLRTLFRLTRLDTLFGLDDDDDGTAGRTAALRPRPPGPMHGRDQIEPPPPEAQR